MVLLFDRFHMPSDIFEVIFSTEQQALVSRLLVNEIKRNKGQINKTEMSMFAKQLHDGITMEEEEEKPFQVIKKKKVQISYNKR